MRRLQVRVLLDTGPTEDEVADIGGMFRDLGMEAVAEGHSYGGPPPTSAFLIVVNGPLVPLLDRISDPEWGGPPAFERVVRRLQAMRADERRWGRPHGVKLEDSHSGHGVSLPGGTPSEAFQELADVDLSSLDRSAPAVELEWSDPLARWGARLTTTPQRLVRRVPRRGGTAESSNVRQVSEAETERLWRMAHHGGGSVVIAQRASIVLWSALGLGVYAVSQRMLVSQRRVRDVIHNFNRDGFRSLQFEYDGGIRFRPTPEERRDAEWIAAEPPARFGLAARSWDVPVLGDFLLAEGVVEDVDPDWLASLIGGGRTDRSKAPAGMSTI